MIYTLVYKKQIYVYESVKKYTSTDFASICNNTWISAKSIAKKQNPEFTYIALFGIFNSLLKIAGFEYILSCGAVFDEKEEFFRKRNL